MLWFSAAACLLLLALSGCQQGSGCDLVKVAQVQLKPIGRRFAVPLTINGRELNMLLDTGAEKTMIAEARAQQLGFEQDGRTATIMVGIGGGSMKADARVDSATLGGVKLSLDRLAVNMMRTTDGADGVLGIDVLRDYDLDIDEPDRTLTLYRVRTCEAATPPWSDTPIAIEPASTLSGWMQVPIEIDGVAGTAVLDTGASFTTVYQTMQRGLTEPDMANDRSLTINGVAAGGTKARVHRFKTLRIGPVTVHDPSLVGLMAHPPALTGGRHFADAMIGQDVLRTRRAWLSFATGRVYFSQTGQTGQ